MGTCQSRNKEQPPLIEDEVKQESAPVQEQAKEALSETGTSKVTVEWHEIVQVSRVSVRKCSLAVVLLIYVQVTNSFGFNKSFFVL
jgi:hypothetical protein